MNDFEITFNDNNYLEVWKDMLKRKKIELQKKERIEKLNKIEILHNPTSISFFYDYWQNMFDKAELIKLRIEKLNKLKND
jgi:hypothetical protein